MKNQTDIIDIARSVANGANLDEFDKALAEALLIAVEALERQEELFGECTNDEQVMLMKLGQMKVVMASALSRIRSLSPL